MNQLIKLFLIIILLLCFFKMPYTFYKFAEFGLFAGFIWLGYESYQRNDRFDVTVFFLLAILYNPFIDIPFPNIVWTIFNAFVIIGIILNIICSDENPYDDFTKKDDQ